MHESGFVYVSLCKLKHVKLLERLSVSNTLFSTNDIMGQIYEKVKVPMAKMRRIFLPEIAPQMR